MVFVGLDIEWRPHEISWMSNKSATLQLCIDEKCLIFQLFYVDEISKSLKDFLNSTNFTFVGIEVADDVKKLKNEYGLRIVLRVLIFARWRRVVGLRGFVDQGRKI
ncbi:hypothetical protein RDI58_011676 [Solanum bulbocastanum]|uniref:3'-5' exonuclease domain-containing protein n=1 Tax=Solanum bulbocastanum TaxID=147425 RepID=A0AAN8YH85_SOLBU